MVRDKIAENDKDIADRQNRERNIINLDMPEPLTNLLDQRVQDDREKVDELIGELDLETAEQIAIEKVTLLGFTKNKFLMKMLDGNYLFYYS